MEETVLSVCSVYKKRVFSSDFATAIRSQICSGAVDFIG
jgi:hypothetical protein